MYILLDTYMQCRKKRPGFPQKPSGLDPSSVSRPRRPLTFYFPPTVGLLLQPSAAPRTLALACSQESGILSTAFHSHRHALVSDFSATSLRPHAGRGGRRCPSRRRRFALRAVVRSEEHTSELQSLAYLVCR